MDEPAMAGMFQEEFCLGSELQGLGPIRLGLCLQAQVMLLLSACKD